MIIFWNNVHPSINFVAMDKDKKVYGFSEKPSISFETFRSHRTTSMLTDDCYYMHGGEYWKEIK